MKNCEYRLTSSYGLAVQGKEIAAKEDRMATQVIVEIVLKLKRSRASGSSPSKPTHCKPKIKEKSRMKL